MFNRNLVFEQNEHWETNKVNNAYRKEYRRESYSKLVKSLRSRRITLLKGLRRTGKTVLMFQLIEELLCRKTPGKNVFYFSFDQSQAELEEIMEFYSEEILQQHLKGGKIYVFLDEVQKLPGWQNKVKSYYDTYPNIKFVLTGSANITLARAKESLAGRINVHDTGPLSFREYLGFNGLPTGKLSCNKIKPHLEKYMKRGLFFETMDMDSKELHDFIQHTLIDRILYVDLPAEYEIKDRELLKRLYSIILSNPGLLLDYQSIAQQLGRDRRTVESYVSYLEYGMLLRKVYNYSRNMLTSERKLKKAYPMIIHGTDDPGRLAENIVLINSESRFFFRDSLKREVDFVLTEPILPVEVKYRKGIQKRDLKGLLAFMEKYKLKKGTVITKDIKKTETIKGKTVSFVPLWKWLLA